MADTKNNPGEAKDVVVKNSLCQNTEITPEILEPFFKQYGKNRVRGLEIPTTDEGAEYIEVVALVPDRATMSQYMKYMDINPKKAQEILVKQCIKTELERIMADDALFMTASSLLGELIPIREGRVKKF